MLSTLTLSNVALIKKETVEFKKGFNCLLGQSGAGKSIIIDALSFLLGAKADKDLIRSGETNLRVDGVFSQLSEEEKNFLNENEVDFEDEIIITRTLNTDGKSTCKINGYPVTAKMLKDFALSMADFCGQHDSVGLLDVKNHLSLLDKFAGNDVEDLKNQCAVIFDELTEIERKIKLLGGNDAERERTKDLLRFQIQEIENADLKIGEQEELKERLDFISSAEKIFETMQICLEKLDGQQDNVTTLLYDVKSTLSGFSEFKDVEGCRERVENCYYELKDVVDVLEQIKQNAEFDPKELERIDGRLDLIKSLSKKYGRTVEEILKYLDKTKLQLEELENNQEIIGQLNESKIKTENKLLDVCKVLSEKRKRFALNLEKKLTEELDDLEMKGTYFKVDFQQVECSKKGFDAVKFMFSANQGQELKDLHKTASGGELSRLLLAFKNVMLDKEKVQTVVFDEIDSGISGRTAGKLAEKLSNIAKFTQVICITHTPVVASKSDAFLLVEKKVVDGNTVSSVRSLNDEEAIYEVARLIDGGNEVSNTAVEHARKLFA